MQQMNDNVVFHPMKGEQLTRNQKQRTLWVIVFLKHKWYIEIKGRAVADGWKKIVISKKSDVTSPTAATELVLITAAIDAAECWDISVIGDISVIDAPWAFMAADMDENVIVVLEN